MLFPRRIETSAPYPCAALTVQLLSVAVKKCPEPGVNITINVLTSPPTFLGSYGQQGQIGHPNLGDCHHGRCYPGPR